MGAEPAAPARCGAKWASAPAARRGWSAPTGSFPAATGTLSATAPGADDERIFVDLGKALAAFLETQVTGRTPFDDFRDALARDDAPGRARYPAAAVRGLRLFVGRGNCTFCHFGPAFTNGEFADAGVPHFVEPGRVDPAGTAASASCAESPYTLLGRFNDDAQRSTAAKTRYVRLRQSNFGEFRVPGLRNVALTAPYMHAGSLADARRRRPPLFDDRRGTAARRR